MNAIQWDTKSHAAAYILGAYLSDGSANFWTGQFCLYVRDKPFADTVASAMREIGAPFTLTVNKKLYWLVNELAPYNMGTRLRAITGDKCILPHIPYQLFPEVVAGVMDGDGGIHHSVRGGWSLYASGKCPYLPQLLTTLEFRGVRVRWSSPQYGIHLRNFIDKGFFFRMSRKQELLLEYAEWRASGPPKKRTPKPNRRLTWEEKQWQKELAKLEKEADQQREVDLFRGKRELSQASP